VAAEKASNDEIGLRLATAIESSAAALAQSTAPAEISENEKFGQVVAAELSHMTEYQQTLAKQQIFSVLLNVRFSQQGQFVAPSHSQDLSFSNL
jgi:hypothetical protein